MSPRIYSTSVLRISFATVLVLFLTCRTDAAEIKGVVRDGDGNAVPFANLILYHQGNHTTTTMSGADGTYTITTESLGSQVIITALRRGYVAKSLHPIAVPVTPTGPIVQDIVLDLQPRPERGKEYLLLGDPPLTEKSSLDAYAFSAPGATKCVWSVSQATQSSMFSESVTWEPVKKEVQEGVGLDLFRLELSNDICGQFQHVKLRISVEIHYPDGATTDEERVTLLSRSSAYADADLMPVDPGVKE